MFPRLHCKNHILNGAPPGIAALCVGMNSELFSQAMQQFINSMKVSPDKPDIPHFNNHSNHISLEVINIAEERGGTYISTTLHPSNATFRY